MIKSLVGRLGGNSAAVQRDRLRVDTRKFLMGKLAPRIYGDKQTVEHTGTVEQRVTMDDRERMRRLATFLAEDMADGGALIEGEAVPALPEADTPDHTHEQPESDDEL